ncbi:MAG TPA: D-alanyl-D-alanine carboxypeptidase [Candidatus Eisenbacteria bacterium]|nr:D-alanyl-D-alanine carboxypeptidase [Candidatus Eisenbacteria bacterium]
MVLLCPASAAAAFSPEEDLSARAFLLMDAKTGSILLEKEADLRLPPASTTKVLTAVVALESGRKLNDLLKVSKTATRVPASKIYLRPGQSITVEHLLYSVLLSSANDASMVLAEGIAGSVEAFAQLMNQKARELGATNTHFVNPHGLTVPDHYSTARDLALIFRYAMKNDVFQQIVRTKISSVRSLSPGKRRPQVRLVSVRNHNRLLWNFDGAIGGKTGYTHAAQKCFVGAVERNGVTLIVALLGSRDLWGDTKRLLEHGFTHYDLLKAAVERPARTRAAVQAAALGERASPSIISTSDPDLRAADGYFLQVGSFRDRDRAESLVKRFSQIGFDAFLEPTSLRTGETAYRVRLGPYALYPEARERAEQITNKFGQQPIIVWQSVVPEGVRERSGDRS